MTKVEPRSDAISRKSTLKLSREYFGEYPPCYNGTVLYMTGRLLDENSPEQISRGIFLK